MSHDLGQHTLIFAVEKETKKERTMFVVVNLILGLILVPFLLKGSSRLDKTTFVLFCACFSPFIGIPMYYLFKWIMNG